MRFDEGGVKGIKVCFAGLFLCLGALRDGVFAMTSWELAHHISTIVARAAARSNLVTQNHRS
jgi:hypothetical protein